MKRTKTEINKGVFEDESLVIQCFRQYSQSLKDSQDKYERIFKARRDVVIESKRIIFLLHSIDRESKRATVFAEAKARLQTLADKSYKMIADEIKKEDPYKYYRAISPGNQEYIEALTLLEYMENGNIRGPESCSNLPFVPFVDYILGLADLTGELMRQCVSSIGAGNVADVSKSCLFLQQLYTAMSCVSGGRDLYSKLNVVAANVNKVERICYNLHVLGSEVPNHALIRMENEGERDDEGYYG